MGGGHEALHAARRTGRQCSRIRIARMRPRRVARRAAWRGTPLRAARAPPCGVQGGGAMNADWLRTPFERRSIQHAMKVWDEEGKLLGRVKAIGQTVLFVQRRPSRELWAVPLDHVRGVSGRGVS